MIFRRIQFIQLRLITKISGSSVSLVLLHHLLYDRKDIRPVQTRTSNPLRFFIGRLSWDRTHGGVGNLTNSRSAEHNQK